MMRKMGWSLMALLAVMVAIYAMAIFFVPAMRPPLLRELFATVPLATYLHIGVAGIALGVGPFQLSARFRARFLSAHRWMGRAYVVAVLVGGASGLVLATVSQGGMVAHLGFGILAVLWLLTTVMAYRRIRAGDKVAHRRWMIRSYALTFAAVTLRMYVPLSYMLGIPQEIAYPAIAWLCWVPNLILVEQWMRHPRVEGVLAPVPQS